MRTRKRSYLPVFEATIVAALVLIGWAAYRLYMIVPEVDQSRQQLSQLRDEFHQLGDFVQTNINELDESLAEFVQTGSPESRKMFEARNAGWDRWMSQKRRVLSSAQAGEAEPTPSDAVAAERHRHEPLPLLDKIEMPHSNYVKAAEFLFRNRSQPFIQDLLAAREQTAQRAKNRLLSFARQAQMRGDALELVLANSLQQHRSLATRFEQLRVGLSLAIVALCLLLAAVLYWRMIGQSRALLRERDHQRAEQQTRLDKLAHFGQLAQELAHEIKQPLTAINARVYTLQKTLPSGSETHKDAAVICSEIDRLNRIVRDFLELARPAEPAPVPVEAQETLDEIRDLMATQFAQDSIEFACECEPDLRFMADPLQLKQVLINLVKNAAECLAHHGTITVRAKRGTRQLKANPTEVAIIEIEDTGPGIPPEIKERIFDPFFSTKRDGTGLGLAIAARIIDKHGGRLEFDTELGKGTVFRIALPACRNGQPA